MSGAEPTTIPYERQYDPHTSRMCGAACLSMVYRSFGKQVRQPEIWPAIAKQNRFGKVSSTTHLMAQDALNRGFGAVAIQARHPLQVLRFCRDFGIRAILNHRLARDTPTGHYSVFVDLNDRKVVLHDPLLGASRRLTFVELLELWLPGCDDSEIAGNVLVAISAPGTPLVSACAFCRTPIPPSVGCPRCTKPVGLRPSAVLGCVNDACAARMWDYICCPSCDYMWGFSLKPGNGAPIGISGPSTATVASAGGSGSGVALDVDKLFGEIDKFCVHILGLPGTPNHPEMKKQLDYIRASKEKFKLAYTEQVTRGAMLKRQLAEVADKVKAEAGQRKKQVEDLDRPSPPLDGSALGRDLLKNLGLVH